ncbi:acyl-CoA N-acyltransferase [Leptodontidium sp. MPI-SDFR-AT-0119]|nr:acyl-CoA N-acyltransferase [Leptodontidium sp. MPI-SDFR-AT-0119]
MVLKTLLASVHDAEEIGALMFSVSTSPRLTLEFANCSKEERQAWVTNGIRSELAACEACGEDACVLKVVEAQPGEKEIIVGFAIWVWSEKAYKSMDSSRVSNPLPQGVNLALRQTFTSSMDKMEDNYRPKRDCYVLEQLATSPSYQRRGIGSQLVKHGLEKADREGMVCYLSAAPMGVAVYRKLGFEEVGRMEIPLKKFGGSGTHAHVAMVRKPKIDKAEANGIIVGTLVGRMQIDDMERESVLAPLQCYLAAPMGTPYMHR